MFLGKKIVEWGREHLGLVTTDCYGYSKQVEVD